MADFTRVLHLMTRIIDSEKYHYTTIWALLDMLGAVVRTEGKVAYEAPTNGWGDIHPGSDPHRINALIKAILTLDKKVRVKSALKQFEIGLFGDSTFEKMAKADTNSSTLSKDEASASTDSGGSIFQTLRAAISRILPKGLFRKSA